MQRFIQAAAREIARAATLAADFSKNLLEERAHVLSSGRMLSEEHVPTVLREQESDRFLGLRNLGGEESKVFARGVFEHTGDDS